ncbi:MAG: shikimate dehydrogenase [Pirellula sp.]|nr:shikimate dehydrogenase [Pirellula sp.]
MPTDELQQIVCCFGQPVAGNPTQYMMEKAFARAGLEWRYLTLEVPPEGLADAVRGLRAMGFRGGNLTIPHKVAVIPLLNRLTPAAEMMGAVNCMIREGNELVGENTDGKGFVQSLRELLDPAGKRVVLLGAGGAARAVGIETALAGAAQFTVVNRNAERGETLAKLIQDKTGVPTTFVLWQGDYSPPADTEVLINCTSIGLNDEMGRVPVDFATVAPECVVADVVFNPAETLFLKAAKARGCRALDGLGMLVNQGAIAFKRWTGVDPDTGVMRDAVEEFLEA